MAHVACSVTSVFIAYNARGKSPYARRQPAARRMSTLTRAELPSDRDPSEAERPLGGDDAVRFFTVDGRPPALAEDWRLFRAQMVAAEQRGAAPDAGLSTRVRPKDAWAHLISSPEQGCLLVARQPDLGMFSHSVLLVSEHENAEGTSALMLNAPTPMCIAHLGLEECTTAAFGRNPLFLGGPMNKNLLHVLHGRREVEGAMRILDGVYAGGVDSAIDLVRRGAAPAGDFRLLAGYSGWGPGQLEREVEEGSWWVVAASPALIHACLSGAAQRDLVAQLMAGGEADPRLQCWRQVLSAAGVEAPHQI